MRRREVLLTLPALAAVSAKAQTKSAPKDTSKKAVKSTRAASQAEKKRDKHLLAMFMRCFIRNANKDYVTINVIKSTEWKDLDAGHPLKKIDKDLYNKVRGVFNNGATDPTGNIKSFHTAFLNIARGVVPDLLANNPYDDDQCPFQSSNDDVFNYLTS